VQIQHCPSQTISHFALAFRFSRGGAPLCYDIALEVGQDHKPGNPG
jgi:hypothetical protein